MFHPTFLSQKVRIQLVRIHIIGCEAKPGTVEVLCKNNTPLLHCCWQCVFLNLETNQRSRSRRKFCFQEATIKGLARRFRWW